MVTVEQITRVSDRLRCNAEGARMPVLLRRATEADAKHVESLLAELGYPSKEADVRHRLRNSLRSDTSCFLLAQSASEVVGLVCAELVPYFPNGSTICRVTGLVVSTQHRGRGVGEKILPGPLNSVPTRRRAASRATPPGESRPRPPASLGACSDTSAPTHIPRAACGSRPARFAPASLRASRTDASSTAVLVSARQHLEPPRASRRTRGGAWARRRRHCRCPRVPAARPRRPWRHRRATPRTSSFRPRPASARNRAGRSG